MPSLRLLFACLLTISPAFADDEDAAIDFDFGAKQIIVPVSLKAGVPQVFAFTAIEPFVMANIVLASSPASAGKRASVTLSVATENAEPIVEEHNMNETSVRSTDVEIAPGRYYFTLESSRDYAFNLGVRCRKAKAAAAPRL